MLIVSTRVQRHRPGAGRRGRGVRQRANRRGGESASDLDAPMTVTFGHDDASAVEVDFTGVTFCDSSGMAALDRAYAAAVHGRCLSG